MSDQNLKVKTIGEKSQDTHDTSKPPRLQPPPYFRQQTHEFQQWQIKKEWLKWGERPRKDSIPQLNTEDWSCHHARQGQVGAIDNNKAENDFAQHLKQKDPLSVKINTITR